MAASWEETFRLKLEAMGHPETRRLREEVDNLAGSLKKADVAGKEAGESVAAGADKAQKGIGNLGMATSRFLQDAAAGFSVNGLQGSVLATSNNLEALMMALGATGLGGALLTIAYTAAPLVMKAMGDIFKLDPVEKYSSRIDELKAQLKTLEDKPTKLAVDLTDIEAAQREIANLEASLKAVEAALRNQSQEETKSGKAVSAAIAETPGARAILGDLERRAIGEAMMGPGVQNARKQLASVTGLRDMLVGQGKAQPEQFDESIAKAQEALSTATARAEEAGRGKIGGLLNQAQTGQGDAQDRAADTLADMFAAQPGGAAAAEAIRNATKRRMRDAAVNEAADELVKESDARAAAGEKASTAAAAQGTGALLASSAEGAAGAQAARARAAANAQADAGMMAFNNPGLMNQAMGMVAAGGTGDDVAKLFASFARGQGQNANQAQETAQVMLATLRGMLHAMQAERNQLEALRREAAAMFEGVNQFQTDSLQNQGRW
jgi:trimeric autotransporter adhesin